MYFFVRNPFSRLVQLALIFLPVGGELLLHCTSRLAEHKSTTAMNLPGRWKKITRSNCSAYYPAVIDFTANGLYTTEADSGATVHPIWDVGTFTVKPDQVSLSTANDAIVAYKTSQLNGQLTFHTPDGCTITYEKL